MTTIRTTGSLGRWTAGGGSVVITEPTPGPQADVTVVDPADRQGNSAWAESLRNAYLRACRAPERAEDDGDSFSTDDNTNR